jgi:predicted ArsR family transcriptional regulator
MSAEGTRETIVHLLRCGPRTADEIAEAVGLTTNAVRQQLAVLERDGYVERRGSRHASTVGKPPIVFAIAPSVEANLSRAYAPVLTALVAALPDHVGADSVDALLDDAGARLAASVPPAHGDFNQRVRSGAAVLESLGGLIEIDGNTLRACSCVLAEAVAVRPELCRAVERFLSAVTGADVRETCDRSERGAPRCRFVVSPRRPR